MHVLQVLEMTHPTRIGDEESMDYDKSVPEKTSYKAKKPVTPLISTATASTLQYRSRKMQYVMPAAKKNACFINVVVPTNTENDFMQT